MKLLQHSRALTARLVAALLLCLVLPQTSTAQVSGNFSQIDMEGGGWLTGIIQHPAGRLYARTDVGGIYRSDDRGESWNFLSGDFKHVGSTFVQSVAVAPSNADIVYQACGVSYFDDDPERGVWKSSDGGATWTHVLPNINFSGNDEGRQGGECLLIHPTNENEVWAGSRANGLWRSTNAGGDWAKVGTTFDNVVILGVYAHPNFPDQLWVSGEGGLWVSTDRGSSWTRILDEELIYRVVRKADGTTFAIGGAANPETEADTHVWKFSATNWADPATYTSDDIWPNYLDAFEARYNYRRVNRAACISLLRDGRLITGPFFDDLGISSDDGDTFTLLSRDFGPNATIPQWSVVGETRLGGGFNQLLQDVTIADRWYVTGGYGPGLTTDGGATWDHNVDGIGEVVCWKIQFHATDPNKVAIPNADHGLAVSLDGGDSNFATGYIARHFPWPDDILSFAHTAFWSGNRIIAPGGEAINQNGRVYVSEDNGTTWNKRAPNGWTEIPGAPFIGGVAAADNADELLLLMGGNTAAGAGGIYRSTDAGLSFAQVPLPAAAQGIWSGNEFTRFAWLERDGAGSDRRYFQQRWTALYRSEDRGQSWAPVAGNGLTGNASFYDGRIGTDDAVAGRLWLAAADGLWRSTNAGDNWIERGGFEEAEFVDAYDGRVAVYGRRPGDTWKKIYYSDDNGDRWDEITRENFRFPSTLALAVDPYREGTVWISTGGRSVARFTPGPSLSGIQQWRATYFGAAANTGPGANSADPDGDGWQNLAEYALGSVPDNAGSQPTSSFTIGDGNGRFAFDRVPRPDVTIAAEASRDMIDWTLSIFQVVDTPSLYSFEGPPNEARVFFRLRFDP